jgi:hypothetical protein
MTFLNSIYLAALAAIVIPLLIHFLSRRRIKIIDFSSLKFLFQMQKTRLRWLRIRDIILLLLRILTLAFLALAFARPALTGKHGSSHAPTSAVLLIDNSPSSERLSSSGILYDDIKKGALQTIGLLGPSDDISFVTLSGKPTLYGPFSDLVRVKDALYTTTPGAATPSIYDGLKKAKEILTTSKNLNRDIYVFTDMQSGSWWDNLSANVADSAFRYYVIGYTENDFDNVGISSVQFPPQLLTPGEDFSISANLKNYSDKMVNGRLAELYLDNVKKAQTAVDLKSQAIAIVDFTVAATSPGHHRGYIEIEDDDYAPDNRFYFDFDIPATISVLAVGQAADDLVPLANCLGQGNIGYINYTGITLGEFSRQNLRSFNVMILNNIAAIPIPYLNSIQDFLNNGGGLFIIMGGNALTGTFQRFLGDNAGITIGEKFIAGNNPSGNNYFDLKDFDLTHPIFKIYSVQGREPLEIPELKIKSFVAANGGEALASITDKRAILTQSSKSKMIVFGSGFDSGCSDIARHSFIVPFVIRTVEFLASKTSAAQEFYFAGKPASVNLSNQTQAVSARLVGPSCDLTVPVSRGAYGAFVNIAEVGFPGFYTLLEDTDTLGYLAANPDSSESTSQIVSEDRLKAILGKEMTYLKGKSDIKTEIVQAKFGLELWKYCLALALVCLIIESILVREPKQKAQ